MFCSHGIFAKALMYVNLLLRIKLSGSITRSEHIKRISESSRSCIQWYRLWSTGLPVLLCNRLTDLGHHQIQR